jgi:uncharacterized protein YceH (UPF0502 family)
MKIELTPHEARVLGCLLEKEVTTPEQYPLSLNALVNACNQKSNRDPLMDLDEATVQQVVDALRSRQLVSDRSGYSGRVPKYKQVFCNTEFGTLRFTGLERAIVCELLLRGPQSAGELRTRCARMVAVGGVEEVEAALQVLMDHAAGPFVARLPRAAGQRDLRYAHLLGGDVPAAPAPPPPGAAAQASPAGPSRDVAARLQALEDEVRGLRGEVEALRARLGPG